MQIDAPQLLEKSYLSKEADLILLNLWQNNHQPQGLMSVEVAESSEHVDNRQII